MDSDLFKGCTYGKPPDPVDELLKDIRDVEQRDLIGFDAVIHLAGLSNDPLGDLNPRLTKEINCNGSIRLASLAKESGIRKFLFASSCSNYGVSHVGMVDEKSKVCPLTPYSKSKIEAEKGIAKLASTYFCPVFLRCATAYGLSSQMRFDLVLNNLTAWAYTTKQVKLNSDGTAWRPVVHIGDISLAFRVILEERNERVCNKVFNVGKTSENYQVYDLAEIVQKMVPDSKIKLSESRGADARTYKVNFDLLPDTIADFKPVWNVKEGVSELMGRKSTSASGEQGERTNC